MSSIYIFDHLGSIHSKRIQVALLLTDIGIEETHDGLSKNEMKRGDRNQAENGGNNTEDGTKE